MISECIHLWQSAFASGATLAFRESGAGSLAERSNADELGVSSEAALTRRRAYYSGNLISQTQFRNFHSARLIKRWRSSA